MGEFDAEISYIQGRKNHVADLLTRQITPLSAIPPAWLPVDTFDTVKYINPDAQKGYICIDLIPLEAVNLYADEIIVVQKLDLHALIDNAHDEDY